MSSECDLNVNKKVSFERPNLLRTLYKIKTMGLTSDIIAYYNMHANSKQEEDKRPNINPVSLQHYKPWNSLFISSYSSLSTSTDVHIYRIGRCISTSTHIYMLRNPALRCLLISCFVLCLSLNKYVYERKRRELKFLRNLLISQLNNKLKKEA